MMDAIRIGIDALFQPNEESYVYVEIKYNDDHDTGKFVDINRKFIKTYAGLVNDLGLPDGIGGSICAHSASVRSLG